MWLIAGGGTLFLAFPRVYAAAFSGLYFGLFLVLWLLIGRGLGIELRHQIAADAARGIHALREIGELGVEVLRAR